jgi:putative ABC transport system permease protein
LTPARAAPTFDLTAPAAPGPASYLDPYPEPMRVHLRGGLRRLARLPGQTAVIVTVLSAGLGVGIAVFTTLNEALLRPPPGVVDPGRVVTLQRFSPERGHHGFTHRGFLEYRELARSFSGMAAARSATLLLDEGGEISSVAGMLVTEGYLQLLGVSMSAGRRFLPEEEALPGAAPVAILGHRFWRALGGDREVVGSRLRLNGAWFTVVGVTAPGFDGLEVATPVDVWLPLAMEAQARPLFPVLGSDLFTSLGVVARLAPGSSLNQARAELDAIAARVERPAGGSGETPKVVVAGDAGRAGEEWRGFVLAWSLPLAAGAALFLALVVSNVAGVLLARSVPRRREMAVRLALGASRRRIARQLLGDGLLLAIPAAAGGLLVSRLVAGLITRAVPGLRLAVDPQVVLFALGLAVVVCVAAATAPALVLVRHDLTAELRDQGSTPRAPRLWRTFIAGQIALSLTLLTVATMLVRSVRADGAEDPGFDTAAVHLVELDLRLAGFTVAEARSLERALVERVAAIPGVATVSAAAAPPIDRGWLWAAQAAVPDGDAGPILARRNPVGPGYFEALGTSVVAGRGFSGGDGEGAPRVAVVNEAMAARLGTGSPLGRTLRFPTLAGPGEPVEIVGVARDARSAFDAPTPEPEVFIPLAQTAEPGMVLLFRPTGDPARVAGEVREAIRPLVPQLPAPRVESVRDRRLRTLSDERLYARLASLLGAVGLLLAAMGLHGTVSFDMARRRREIAIRMALGAGRRRARWAVIRDSAIVIGAGIAVGLAGSAGAARLLRGALHGAPPPDPVTLGLAAGVIVAVAAVTAWLATGRVDAVDPANALRSADAG